DDLIKKCRQATGERAPGIGAEDTAVRDCKRFGLQRGDESWEDAFDGGRGLQWDARRRPERGEQLARVSGRIGQGDGMRAPCGMDATIPDRADACPYTPEPPAGPAVGGRGESRVALGDGQVTGGIQAERADYFVARRSRRRGLVHCLVGGGPNGEYSRLPAVLGQILGKAESPLQSAAAGTGREVVRDEENALRAYCVPADRGDHTDGEL